MCSACSHRGEILVVDDDPIFCSIMEELLRRHGYRVQAAFSVPEAMDLLRQEKPDLILTDVMMPEVDGLTLVRTLRSDPGWDQIPTVVVSARVMEMDRQAAAAAGADGFLEKPFSFQRLHTMINGYLPAV
ncbi:MAG: response regulator [Anaerolineales bacterium]